MDVCACAGGAGWAGFVGFLVALLLLVDGGAAVAAVLGGRRDRKEL